MTKTSSYSGYFLISDVLCVFAESCLEIYQFEEIQRVVRVRHAQLVWVLLRAISSNPRSIVVRGFG